jgi:5'-deoxynucleotidase YfbR-like HD superfamily hydrolase
MAVRRLMKLSIVHDLAESLVGDIVPHDTRYTKEDKRRLEEVRPLNHHRIWISTIIAIDDG